MAIIFITVIIGLSVVFLALTSSGSHPSDNATTTTGNSESSRPSTESSYGYSKRWTIEDVVARDEKIALASYGDRDWLMLRTLAAASYRDDEYARAHLISVCAYLKGGKQDGRFLVDFGSNLFQLACDRTSLALYDAAMDAINQGLALEPDGGRQLRHLLGETYRQNLSLRDKFVETVFSDKLDILEKNTRISVNSAAFDGHHIKNFQTFEKSSPHGSKNVSLVSDAKVSISVKRGTDGAGNSFEGQLYGDITQWPSQIKSGIYEAVNELSLSISGGKLSPQEVASLREQYRAIDVEIVIDGANIDVAAYKPFISWSLQHQKDPVGV